MPHGQCPYSVTLASVFLLTPRMWNTSLSFNEQPFLRLRDGLIDYLTQLPSGGVVAWAELEAPCPAVVARDDAVAVCGLDVGIESVSSGHVPEGRSGRCVDRPAL